MKRTILLYAYIAAFSIQGLAQTVNSALSPPVVIDTEHPQVEVTAPAGGGVFNYQFPMGISWQAYDANPTATPINLGFSLVAGGDTLWLEGNFDNNGFLETLPPQEATEETRAYIKMTDAFGNATIAANDGYFTLEGCALPYVYAGEDDTVCGTESYQLNGIAEEGATVFWSTSGDGSFSDQTLINPGYFPGYNDIDLGSVVLTLTVTSAPPCSMQASDDVMLTLIPPPYVDIIPDNATICEGEVFSFETLVYAANYQAVQWWTPTGTGAFYPSEVVLEPYYQPGYTDYVMGYVEIWVTVASVDPCAAYDEDFMTIYFQAPPEVNAGVDTTICQNTPHQLNGTASNYDWSYWSTTGDGYFSNPEILNPVYYCGTNDIQNGFVELTLFVEPSAACYPTSDSKTLHIQSTAYVNIIPDLATICHGENFDFAGLVELSDYSSLLWFSPDGGNVFSNFASPEPVYYPGPDDYALGCVEIGVLVLPINPCLFISQDYMTLCFQPLPEADAGADLTSCAGTPVHLSGAAEDYNDLQWITFGDGLFDDENILNPVYHPGPSDIAFGAVELCLEALPVSPCFVSDISCLNVTISDGQAFELPSGWSGLSGASQPFNPDIETLMEPVNDHLIIMYNFQNAIYSPFFNINTMVNWDSYSGYVIKMNAPANFGLCGNSLAGSTLELNSGWNLLPVLSDSDVALQDVFGSIGDNLIIVKEVAGVLMWLPQYNIHTLQTLQTGKSYFVKVQQACTITFPLTVKHAILPANEPKKELSLPWNSVAQNPVSHVFVFPETLLLQFDEGDIIGAFDDQEHCVGIMEVKDNSARGLSIFADDPFTPEKDGMLQNEELKFKVFNNKTGNITDLVLTIEGEYPVAVFQQNEISLVKSVENATGVAAFENHTAPVIYPNPAKDAVILSLPDKDFSRCFLEIFHIDGRLMQDYQITSKSTEIDIGKFASGVYIFKVDIDGQAFTQRLVKK
jgi:hypothetical protein